MHHSIRMRGTLGAVAVISMLILGLGLFYLLNKDIDQDEYVGEYYMGYQAHGCILSIKKDSRFSMTWVSWRPDSITRGRVFVGTYRIEDNRLRLSMSKDSFGEAACIVPSMVMVKWQDRKYLFYDSEAGENLERSQIIRSDFCKRVEDGEELRREQEDAWFAVYIELNDKDRLERGEVGRSDGLPALLDGTIFCSG